MANPFADTLHLSVQPSAIHRASIGALHAAAIAVAAILAWSRPGFWALIPLIVLAGKLADRRASLRTNGVDRRK